MVQLTRIYTRGGDKGKTSLGDGKRVAKHDLRVAAYGSTDEANAAIGLARLHCSGALDEMLARLQNDLFDLGADLCRPRGDEDEKPALRITAEQVVRLEGEIDAVNAKLGALKSFVLPGGTPAAAHLHLARTICRRAERRVVVITRISEVSPASVIFLNRLSDLLFAMARRANHDAGVPDVPWTP